MISRLICNSLFSLKLIPKITLLDTSKRKKNASLAVIKNNSILEKRRMCRGCIFINTILTAIA
jgi:hypothetical protein